MPFLEIVQSGEVAAFLVANLSDSCFSLLVAMDLVFAIFLVEGQNVVFGTEDQGLFLKNSGNVKNRFLVILVPISSKSYPH